MSCTQSNEGNDSTRAINPDSPARRHPGTTGKRALARIILSASRRTTAAPILTATGDKARALRPMVERINRGTEASCAEVVSIKRRATLVHKSAGATYIVDELT